jgi:hypothetical protein
MQDRDEGGDRTENEGRRRGLRHQLRELLGVWKLDHVALLPFGMADAPRCQLSSTTIFRTGRLLAPSMPVRSSAFPARPPQPSYNLISRIVGLGGRFTLWLPWHRLVRHLSTFITATWLIETPAAFIAVAISRSPQRHAAVFHPLHLPDRRLLLGDGDEPAGLVTAPAERRVALRARPARWRGRRP